MPGSDVVEASQMPRKARAKSASATWPVGRPLCQKLAPRFGWK